MTSTSNNTFIVSIYYVLETVLSKEDQIISKRDIVPVLLSLQSSRDINIKYHNTVR